MLKSRISGAGMFVPPKVVKNTDLEKLMETSDEWIQQRSGIQERRWAEPGMTTSGMGLEASKAALNDAGKKPDDIDAIIFATLSPDMNFPGSGVLLQKNLCPQKMVPALDVRNQCSGFLYSLSIADAWIRTGMYKCVLVVGSEIHSNGLDISTEGRDVSVLFGDGAGAVVVEPTSDVNAGFLAHNLHSEGEHAERLCILRPSSSDFPRLTKGDMKIDRTFFAQMDGKFVFKNAVTRMCEVIHEACKDAGVKPQDIDFVIAHQANMRINQMVLQQLEIPQDKTLNTIQKYGNTTAATIPIGITEAKRQGLLKKGQLVAMVGFGSGFTWGANLMRWS
ncbi:MAG: ketoacyl-ACP synthase III [Oligoflexia bacterium]|nr:ketoacyl-ACP synthase III [Oligoflexia bacterium]